MSGQIVKQYYASKNFFINSIFNQAVCGENPQAHVIQEVLNEIHRRRVCEVHGGLKFSTLLNQVLQRYLMSAT